MGTKQNPGRFDCYENAEPDEPMFVLLGRDRHAADLVRIWALLRAKEGEDEAVVAEALQCAQSMDRFRVERRGFRFGERPDPIQPLLELLTNDLIEHPDDYDGACLCAECSSYQ